MMGLVHICCYLRGCDAFSRYGVMGCRKVGFEVLCAFSGVKGGFLFRCCIVFFFSFAFILGLAFYTTRWPATILWDVAGMGRSVTSVPGGGG